MSASKRPKIRNCEWCGSEFEDKYRDGKRFCNQSCSTKYKNATFGNPIADILVEKEEQTILVEVKPQWKLLDPKTQLKIEAGRQYATQKGWVFEVWTEKELGI
jgi:hypothetical protein